MTYPPTLMIVLLVETVRPCHTSFWVFGRWTSHVYLIGRAESLESRGEQVCSDEEELDDKNPVYNSIEGDDSPKAGNRSRHVYTVSCLITREKPSRRNLTFADRDSSIIIAPWKNVALRISRTFGLRYAMSLVLC